MIDISTEGLAYFANNDGMLEFDGTTWKVYPLPQGSVVRSVKTTGDGRIYAGGFNEFGYFLPGNYKSLEFHSLEDLLPLYQRDFGDVWKIHKVPQGIVFQSYEQLMIYSENEITVVDAPETFHFSYVVHGELYLVDQTEGLFRLANDRLVRVPGTALLQGQLLWAMLPKGNNILMATTDNGIYEFDGLRLREWKNPVSEMLIAKQVYSALPVNESTYAFGTIQDGLIISDTAGNVIQHINLDKGLQNSTVLSLNQDQYGNLWLGLDNGIDYVEISSPLTFFSHYNNISAGYAAVLHDNDLLFGTNQGVFAHNWDQLKSGGSNHEFSLIQGTQGQVWSLENIDGTLFCGHNSGVYLIENRQARQISDIQGGWTFIKPEGKNNLVICGTYSGLTSIEKRNNKWQPAKRIKGFRESSRFLVNDINRTLWMSHGYKGVFRIHLNEAFDSVVRVDFFNSDHGFPSNRDINVFEISGRIIFTTAEGFYKYDPRINKMIPDEEMNDLFPDKRIIIVHEDQKGNIWYFTPEDTGVLRLQEDGSYVNVDVPFRELSGRFIKWFQMVYPLDETNVFFGLQNGMVHYTPDYPKNYNKPFSAFIRNVSLSGSDSSVYTGKGLGNPVIREIPYRYNDLQFSFAANDFENPAGLMFATRLENFDENWTSWQQRNIREFTNLRRGTYTFSIKARNIFGGESSPATLTFEIGPPWYMSWWAFVLYVILFLLLIFALVKYIRYRMEKSKKQEEERQKRLFREREKQLQTEALKSEKELIRLRNEKLRSEMIQKDKELANNTMQMIQKNKSLSSIKKDLLKLSRDIGDDIITGQVQSMVRKINRDMDSDRQWEVFESHFESVHEEFLKRLKAKYPDLTPRELKLCAYLRLNISSKEIATLMNISTRGVEISRYRLRKKLRLEHDINLTEFIISF
ncbi:MAG: triple tyrosine motif-containing protein [Bacteroidales bacterium]